MNYISTMQAAKMWNISPRRVMNLAKEGRIPDAVKIGSRWMIPESSAKPADGRTRAVKSARADSNTFFRFPAFEGRDVDSFNPPLSPEEKIYKQSSEAFHACRFNEAEKLIAKLLTKTTSRYIRITALYCSCYIHMIHNRKAEFLDCYGRIKAELQDDFPHKKEMSSYIHEIDATLGMSGYFAHEFEVDYSYAYHESYLPHLAMLCLLAMNYSDSSHLTDRDLIPYEYIASSLEAKGCNVDSQTIHFYLGIAYSRLFKVNKMKFHYRKALELTQKHQLYYQAAIIYYYYGKSFKAVLNEFPDDFIRRIHSLSKSIHKSYTSFMKSISASSIYSIIANQDFIYVYFATQGLTIKEIAKILHVSEGTIGKRYGDIYSSLGVKSKAEMVKLYRKSLSI